MFQNKNKTNEFICNVLNIKSAIKIKRLLIRIVIEKKFVINKFDVSIKK